MDVVRLRQGYRANLSSRIQSMDDGRWGRRVRWGLEGAGRGKGRLGVEGSNVVEVEDGNGQVGTK